MSARQRFAAITAVMIVNILSAGFCGFAYAALSANMVFSAPWQGDSTTYTPMAHSGWQGGLTRYLFSALIAFLLEGLLWIFNFSALGYFIDEYKQLMRTCLTVAAVGYAVMVGIACVLIALSLN